MRMLRSAAVAPMLPLLIVLGGCTTSLQSKADPNLSEVAKGIPYRLPATRVDISVNWALEDCEKITYQVDSSDDRKVKWAKLSNLTDNDGAYLKRSDDHPGTLEAAKDGLMPTGKYVPSQQDLSSFELKFGFTPSATLESKTIDGETYLIDYEALTKAFKTGSLTVEYHPDTQRIKSLNASVEGHEIEAAKNVVGFGLNAARFALGVPSTVAASGGSEPGKLAPNVDHHIRHCTVEAEELVKRRNSLVNRVKSSEKSIKEIAAEVAALQVSIATAKDGTDIDDIKKKLKVEEGRLKTVKGALQTQKQALAVLDEQLVVSEKFALAGSGSTFEQDLIPSEKKIRQKLKGLLVDGFEGYFDMVQKAKLSISLAKSNPSDDWCAGQEAENLGCKLSGGYAGLVYRAPVPVEIEVSSSKGRVLKKDLSMLQFGRLRRLPLVNKPGESNSLEVAFNAQGIPTKIGYTKTKSAEAGLVDLAGDSMTKLVKLRDDVKAYEDAKIAAEDALQDKALTDLQRKRDLLKTQSEIDALENPVETPSDLATLQAEVGVLEVEAEIARLKRSIRDAEDDL